MAAGTVKLMEKFENGALAAILKNGGYRRYVKKFNIFKTACWRLYWKMAEGPTLSGA